MVLFSVRIPKSKRRETMTEKLYDKDAYRKIFSARVLKCEQKNGKWQVVLDRTAFYPEGGGQPADTGVLNFVNVLDVQEQGDEIVHTTDKPLPVGLNVMGGVNWTRRFRLMQQHTGEHIVSGIANRLFGVDNVGFHMGEKFMTVDWERSAQRKPTEARGRPSK
jgi:alanyl-tRNA synthetase